MPLVMFKPDQRARLKPCLRCGYSLRNNIDARNCPECGLAVRVSLHEGDALEWSNPAWLRRVVVGTALVNLAHVGLLPCVLYVLPRGHLTSHLAFLAHVTRYIGIVVGVSVVLLDIGAFLLAYPEGRHPDRVRGPRRLLLFLAPACALATAVFLLPIISPAAQRFAGWSISLLAAMTAVLTWSVLYEPARRIPARRASAAIGLLGWGLTLGYTLLFMAFGWRLLLFLQFLPWEPRVLWFTVGWLGYIPVAIGVLTYCWLQFRSAAREADNNWVTDP